MAPSAANSSSARLRSICDTETILPGPVGWLPHPLRRSTWSRDAASMNMIIDAGTATPLSPAARPLTGDRSARNAPHREVRQARFRYQRRARPRRTAGSAPPEPARSCVPCTITVRVPQSVPTGRGSAAAYRPGVPAGRRRAARRPRPSPDPAGTPRPGRRPAPGRAPRAPSPGRWPPRTRAPGGRRRSARPGSARPAHPAGQRLRGATSAGSAATPASTSSRVPGQPPAGLPGPPVFQLRHRVAAGGQGGGERAGVPPVVLGPPEPAVQDDDQRPGRPGPAGRRRSATWSGVSPVADHGPVGLAVRAGSSTSRGSTGIARDGSAARPGWFGPRESVPAGRARVRWVKMEP